MSAQEEHSSFIKTPRQLAVVILLAFVIPIIAIVLLVKLVLDRPKADPAVLAPEAVAARLQPVGRLEFGAAPGARSGEEISKTVCATCHATGAAGAPKLGDKAAWAPRIAGGLQRLVETALKGKGAMPPKGGDPSLSDIEIGRAVAYMANQAGARFKEPAAPASRQKADAAPAAAITPATPPAAPAAAGRPAAADGKQVFEQNCVACHATGVANAPKLGDQAAWAPRVKQGAGALVQSALKGKGAMPPKGGNAALTEQQVRAAVEFMLSNVK